MQVRGGAARLVISDIDYNARGQRVLCKYTNPTTGALTSQIRYDYDPATFRLTRLFTERSSDGALLQDLRYTHDPVGNIVELDDRAATAPIFSGTTPITGDGFYVYDAIYRLSVAKGREHPGQLGSSTQPGPFDDAPGPLPHPNDLQALIRYTEQYSYDQVGNIQTVAHSTTGASNTQWTRRYQYASDSNRLLRTSIPGDASGTFSEAYDYANTATNNAGAHGSMTSMPHLAEIDWDYADRMQRADKGGGGQVFFTYDAAGQRVRKVWEHGVVDERIYLGGYEIFRHRLIVGGGVDLERETLHVTDDQQRVAMAETKTQDGGVPVASPTTRWRFQLDNHLGSAMLELDEAGNVISYEEYHPYGSTSFSAGSASTEVSAKRYRYTGKERDDETGLYYHGARYYAPWLGRWTAADPLGLKDGINVYQFVNSRPTILRDPGGTQSAPSTYQDRNIQLNTAVDNSTGTVGFQLSISLQDRKSGDRFYFQTSGNTNGLGALRNDLLKNEGVAEALTPRERESLFGAINNLVPDAPDFGERRGEHARDAIVASAQPLGGLGRDARTRADLQDEIRIKSEELEARIGTESDQSLREEAVVSRNEATLKAREKLSPLGRGFSEVQKPSNKLPSVNDVVQKRTAQLEGKPFSTEAARTRAITEGVVRGAARGRPGVNALARAGRGALRGLEILGIALAINEVVQAPEGDRIRTAARETVAFGAGVAAAAAVGALATTAAIAGVVAGAPIIAGVAVVVVGLAAAAAAGVAAAALFDYLIPRAP